MHSSGRSQQNGQQISNSKQKKKRRTLWQEEFGAPRAASLLQALHFVRKHPKAACDEILTPLQVLNLHPSLPSGPIGLRRSCLRAKNSSHTADVINDSCEPRFTYVRPSVRAQPLLGCGPLPRTSPITDLHSPRRTTGTHAGASNLS